MLPNWGYHTIRRKCNPTTNPSKNKINKLYTP